MVTLLDTWVRRILKDDVKDAALGKHVQRLTDILLQTAISYVNSIDKEDSK